MSNLKEIDQLLRKVQTIGKTYDIVAKATGERFNIFSILNMETDEVKTHSRLIAELLNENGTHGQGAVFMEKFLECFSIGNFDIKNGYEVTIEKYAGKMVNDEGGRIDIFIRNNRNECILIENKIYAAEQHKQLLRYYNSFSNAKILYLTLYGEESKDAHSKGLKYESVSYETDVIDWLEICQKETNTIPILRETITQYINLIKKLTGQNLNKRMNEDIIERILRDEESMDAYKELVNTKNSLRKKIRVDFLGKLLLYMRIFIFRWNRV